MADFGKLNFSTSFNPTSAFPLDARSYFESLAEAQAAAATAAEVGSSATKYHIGQKLLVVENNTAIWYTIQPDKTLKAEGTGGSADLPAVSEADNGKVMTVVNGAWAASELPVYDGEYTVTPAVDEQMLLTAQKLLDANLKIEKIPYSEVTNTADGTTVTIG